MAYDTNSRWQTRPVFWDVVLALLFGAGLFILLIVVTGGFLFPWLPLQWR